MIKIPLLASGEGLLPVWGHLISGTVKVFKFFSGKCKIALNDVCTIASKMDT